MSDRRQTPVVVAHRGASAAHPPGNTLLAFRAAAELGADGVELDVRRAADGSLVVHHDGELPDGRLINTLSREALPEWVPTLDASLAVCAESGLTVNVEIKNSPLEADFDEDRTVADDVLVALDGWSAADVLISSFDPGSVAKVATLGAPFPTGLLLWDPSTIADALESAAAIGHAAVNPWSPYIDRDLVAKATDLGLAVNAWTVDEPDEMRALIDLGVASIITNVPDVLRSLV